MKVTVQKRDLLRIVARTHAAADRKGTLAILGCVLLDAGGNQLRTSATDLYLGARASTQAAVAAGGSVAVAAKALFDIARTLPDGTVTLDLKNQTLLIKAGRSRFKLPALDARDFPLMPHGADATWHELDAHDLADLLSRTAHAMSGDDTRPHLAGVLLEATTWLRLVTTDGHRLSKAEVARDGGEELTLLIPHRGVGELRKLLDEACAAAKAAAGKDGDASAVVHVARHEGYALFRVGEDVMLSVKLVDERFPPYEKVIPSHLTKRVVCNRVELVDAVKRIALVSHDRTHGLQLDLSAGTLQLSAQNPDVGEGNEELDAEYDGPPMRLGLNSRYLLDALNAASSDRVALGMREALDPVVVSEVGEGAVQYVGVVMPMRIGGDA